MLMLQNLRMVPSMEDSACKSVAHQPFWCLLTPCLLLHWFVQLSSDQLGSPNTGAVTTIICKNLGHYRYYLIIWHINNPALIQCRACQIKGTVLYNTCQGQNNYTYMIGILKPLHSASLRRQLLKLFPDDSRSVRSASNFLLSAERQAMVLERRARTL